MSKEITNLLYGHKSLFKGDKEIPVPDRYGMCSLCGDFTMVVPSRLVVSQAFTDWEVLTPPYAMCPICSWVLSNKDIRLHSILVSDDSVLPDPCPHTIAELYDPAHPYALIVPASKQKQLNHHAEYGRIMTDSGPFTIHSSYLALVDTLVVLRASGFNESDLQGISAAQTLFNAVRRNFTRSKEIFPLIEMAQQHQNLTPELFDTAVLLSRSTYCSANCKTGES